MSAQLTMKNRVNKEKRCSLDKCLSLWYNLSIEIENIFSVLFIAFDETLLTQLPRLSPPQKRVNSKIISEGVFIAVQRETFRVSLSFSSHDQGVTVSLKGRMDNATALWFQSAITGNISQIRCAAFLL